MIKSKLGQIFYLLERSWRNFRIFLHRNESIFDIIFLLVYFFEQFVLVCFTIYYKTDISKMSYIVTFYSLILLTTVGIQGLFMESKNRYIKERHINVIMDYDNLQTEYNLLLNEYNNQNQLIHNLLNDSLAKEKMELKSKIKKK